jgi:hypothetical protein
MPVVHKIDNALEKTYIPFFGLIIFTNVLYFITYFGLMNINQKYIEILNIGIQLFICLFLLVRFNPLRDHELRQYDAKIIFASALLLGSNLIGSVYNDWPVLSKIVNALKGGKVDTLGKKVDTLG